MMVNRVALKSGVVTLPLALLAALTFMPTAQASDLFKAPIETSGDVGYSYRSLTSSQTGDSTSHQGRVSIKARTWLWEPWMATVDLGLRGTFDKSEMQRSGASSENTATIKTGDLGLGILPQSRTPLQATYRASDSRVEYISSDNPLTGLGGREYSTERLEIRQRYFTESGHRLQAYYDINHWDSGTDSYDDWLLGADMSVRLPQQTLTAKASFQDSDYSVLSQNTQTQVLNVDHFYYPGRALRIDSMASVYSYERTSQQPLNSTNLADSSTDLSQLSSFVFWRPEDRPLSVSGGVRLYDLEGVTSGNNVAVQNMSSTAGLFYQWNKNLRLDANMDFSNSDNDGNQITAFRQRVGALYQSDIYPVLAGATWQWYTSSAVQYRDADSDLSGTATVSAGHDTQKIWMPSQSVSWRFSFSQSGSGNRLSDNGVDSDTTQINHSTSLSWDRHGSSGSAMAQVTLADSRQSGDSENNQQFANFQLMGNLNIDRLQTLNGNLTMQNVRRDFNGSGNSDTVSTATGQISYNHLRVMGVPQLRFMSDLRLSKAVSDEWVNRGEWENRLDWAIGLLDVRASWRRTVLISDNDFDLVYIQVSRRF
jgi:hypothetical protein